MKVQFSFQVRQAMAVAMAVAEEIENNSGTPTATNEVRPTLLSVSGTTFRFEGGKVVNVHMVDLDQLTESWRTPHHQDWVVTHCEVRYSRYNAAGYPNGEKVSEVWGADKLSKLKERRPWWHPNVVELTSIKGMVGIFVDNASDEGFLSVDPERNQEGHFTLYESVEYARFVPGDLDRAKAEAREKLSEFLN